MKANLSSLHALLLTAALGLAPFATSHAQSTTTVVGPKPLPSPEAMGTIRTVGPDTMVIQADNHGRPLTYRYAHSIQYVDESGKVVNRQVLVPGLPVTVEGIREGDSILATRVIVHQQVAKAVTTGPQGTTSTTTTTTTTQDVKKTEAQGILGMWEADRFELHTPKDGTASFLYHKNTEFVDADGKHVDAIQMHPGMPVTVRFEQEGDRLVANRVTLNARIAQPTR